MRLAMRSLLLIPLIALLGIVLDTPAQSAERTGDQRALITSQTASGELSGWKSFHEDAKARTGDVWKLTDDGVLVCKGAPKGYLYTEKDHLDFVLELEWRWPPGKKSGNGGVLIRMTGDHKIWPRSLEAQANAGQAGDFWGLLGYPLDGPKERKKTVQHPQLGTLTNLAKLKPVEKPAGEWNRYKIVADGGVVTLVINGQDVNRATGCELVPGKICLTAEGDEIHFRNVRLRPIAKSPE
jgi:hypothetical protein